MIVWGECGRIVEIYAHGAAWTWARDARPVWTLYAPQSPPIDVPVHVVAANFPQLRRVLAQ